MAEATTQTPTSSPLQKAEKWAGNHKVVVGVAGLGGAFLLLSRRGSSTIQGAAVAATDETGVDIGSTGDDEPIQDIEPEPDIPVVEDPPVTPDPDSPAPVVDAPVPVTPTLTAPPPAAAPVTPGPTISTVPSETSRSIANQVKYTTVPGYYSVIYAYTKSTGDAYEWHHYTSGTRAGDKVRVNLLGNYGKNINAAKLGNGFAPGTLGMGDFERYVTSVQYESTQVAAVTTP